VHRKISDAGLLQGVSDLSDLSARDFLSQPREHRGTELSHRLRCMGRHLLWPFGPLLGISGISGSAVVFFRHPWTGMSSIAQSPTWLATMAFEKEIRET
jgi:hypothetical protein